MRSLSHSGLRSRSVHSFVARSIVSLFVCCLLLGCRRRRLDGYMCYLLRDIFGLASVQQTYARTICIYITYVFAAVLDVIALSILSAAYPTAKMKKDTGNASGAQSPANARLNAQPSSSRLNKMSDHPRKER